MKHALLLLVGLSLFGACRNAMEPKLNETVQLSSSINDFNYRIKISLPADYHQSEETYPTLYVLDGWVDYGRVYKNSQEIADEEGFQALVVVRIMNYGNKGRTYDYTPTEALEGIGGGADDFLGFITEDLVPYMEDNYRVGKDRNTRCLMGHSLGGLCATYAFTHYNQEFQYYLTISPGYWWDEEVIFSFEEEKRDENQQSPSLLYIGYGGVEELSISLPAEAFSRRMEKHYVNCLHLMEEIPGKSHFSTKGQSIKNALTFYYENQW